MTLEIDVLSVVTYLLDAVCDPGDQTAATKKVMPYISSHRQPSCIGMASYWNNAAGIGGEFKQRYTDFIVNEITPEGKVIRLSSNLDIPSAPWLVSQKKAISNQEDVDVEKYFSKEIVSKLKELAEEVASSKDDFVEISASDDKELRTRQHEIIKTMWPSLSSETVNTSDGFRSIRVSKKQRGDRRRNEGRWPGDRRYCHFILNKEQLDTSAVLSYLSKCLHVPVKTFQFAGMKDKRGSTTQRISADRVSAQKILGAVKSYRNVVSSMLVSDFSYEAHPVNLGDLAGNHFQVALRDIRCPNLVDDACESVKKFGFANYFGPQRFGTASSFSTADIGRFLLQCQWSKAVNAIIKAGLETKFNRYNDSSVMAEASSAWFDNRDAETAAKLFPGPYRCAERQMLMSLAKNKSDIIGALRKVPRTLLLMYVHAYQSLVWNRIVARRIERFGNTAVITGDLVASNGTEIFNDPLDFDDTADSAPGDDDLIGKPMRSSPLVHFATPEDVGQTNIADVVLPLPGFDVFLPKNVIGDWYKEILQADGVKFTECGQQMPELMLNGTYRPLMVKPSNFSWRSVTYEHHTDQLNVTEKDRVMNSSNETEIAARKEGSQNAVILDFELPACCYASVLVWELSKNLPPESTCS